MNRGERASCPGLEHAIRLLAATRIPILLLHGRNDARFPATHAHHAAARLANAEAVVIDDAAHMAHIDQPATWASAVRTFLHER
jgi:pimeloyl-ACP methyl ester carboxylesterase